MTFLLGALQVAHVMGFFHLVSFGTYGVTLAETLLVVAVIYVAYNAIWLGKPLVIPVRLETLAVVLLWCAFGASAFTVAIGGHREFAIQALKTFLHFTVIWAGAIAIMVTPVDSKQWLTALRVNLVVSLVISLYAIYQIAARMYDLPLAWIDVTNASFKRGLDAQTETGQLALKFKNFFRATSLFPEPSALASYTAVALMALVIPILRVSRGAFQSRFLTWLMIAAGLIATLLAFSLTGVLLLAAATVLVVFLYPRTAVPRLLMSSAGALVLILVTNTIVFTATDFDVLDMFGQRISSVVTGKAADQISDEGIAGESLSQRTSDYAMSAAVWEEHPVVGIGPGCFQLSTQGKQHNSPFVSTTYGSVLAELGGFGFLALAGLYICLTIGLVRDERKWSRLHRGSAHPLEPLAPYLPFKMLQVLLISFTGNSLISATMWTDIALLIGCQTAIRRELGIETSRYIRVVEVSLRNRVAAWLRKGAQVGADH